MTLPTKILLASVLVIAGTSYANAEVRAKDAEALNFAPAPAPVTSSRGPASVEDTQFAISIPDEIADNRTEGGSCQVSCNPAFTVNPKTALAHIDIEKVK